ncbi:MAG: 4'-phosphopantetheinyl transferase superfamily protein [Elusimicrobiaceae bacterium]|nr:4'-phosphopantetheinyl transferase superfamily protein [Elusimicrobiaceae bacterium]
MNFRYLIVKTDETPKAEDFLTTFEYNQYQQFNVDKRAAEWLAGRYAVKKLATEFFNLPMLKMQVRNTQYGVPVLRAEGGNHLTISVSHSGEYAAAAISLTSDLIGIDVEKIEPRTETWAKEFFHDEEILENTPSFLTELWAKKEAVLKLLQIGLSVPAKDVKIIGDKVSFYGKILDVWALKGSPKIAFEIKELPGGYKLVVAYPEIY